MNAIFLVGTIIGEQKIVYQNQKDRDQKLLQFWLRVPRAFKNEHHEHDFDTIKIKVWLKIIPKQTVIADQEVVAVRGRVQSYYYKNNDQSEVIINDLIAEQITNLISEY